MSTAGTGGTGGTDGAGDAGGAGGQRPGGTGAGRLAELRAAVRAVESGEREAASFFAAPEPPRRGRRPAAAPGAAEAVPERAAVPVPGELAELLAAGGAPAALAGPVAAALGGEAAAVLRTDPWQLLSVPGVRPEQADGFARALLGPGCGPGDERRVQALAGWLLERAARAGHTVLRPEAVRAELGRHAVPDPEQALRIAVESGALLVFRDPLAGPGGEEPDGSADDGEAGNAQDAGDAGDPGGPGNGDELGPAALLGLDRYAVAEEALADGLARLCATFLPPAAGSSPEQRLDGHPEGAPGDGGPARPPLAAWQRLAASQALSPSAAELLRAVAEHALVVHTGGEAARAEPLAVVRAARSLGLRAWAAVDPLRGGGTDGGTEDAGPVLTLPGLLSGREGPGRDEEGMPALDLLAVLDTPRLDTEAAAELVEALPDGCRLILSGDPAVLGAAGAGQVLADVAAARICPRVVSRTPDPGPVGELVSGIGAGELAEVAAPGREVVVVPVRDAGEAVHRTVQLVTESIPRAFGVSAAQIQVITPGHGGAAGTRALNRALKERLNAGPGRFGGFDPGDRVLFSPAPGLGRAGTVVSADDTGLLLECGAERFTVPPARVADTVRPGWALTAHQAAGGHWPAVVTVLPGDAAGSVDRTWVYTAFGRAGRHLSVVQGLGPALARAVAAPPAAARTTRLAGLLRQQQAAQRQEEV
ncbi:helix-hairpin-helix domain-containing protein [Streptomyces aidingensis]|uniref:UvrD-like helicase C-terminal domain-containing protein n=1 Tax=Streptomyces aidingensis TaxID=910347 RepID=A0A1I1S184_9ACTN|nr:helix-hairpin-helix domain-containing protein [Streptomyces aidingensis]SFD40097.1 UvrD-like helicase C-terminal domain-containing protein [Streptomyces aidingensis]